jgi:serine phosphatase RsbU (regulator of sigma subunit)
MPPASIHKLEDADVALLRVNGYASLLTLLPTILDLQTNEIPTVLCCDDFGDLSECIDEIGVTKLSYDARASMIAGVLFGMCQRNEQVSKLRSQVGLIQTLHSDMQDNLSLITNELEVAATVQKEFMSTEVNDVHGVSFSSLWRPASVVSGDMYDITQLDEDHVALFIADAIGHGISAAMLAMMLTRTLAANRFDSATGKFTQPSDILHSLNTALLERTGDSARFATAAYGILNCKTNQFTYAGAGHPPSLLSRFGKEPILLDSDGPLLGVFEHEDFHQQTIEFCTGDTLLMYSDGFETALGNQEYADGAMPTYLHSMQGFCTHSPDDILQQITAYLNQTSPSIAEDDLTMICMRAKTLPASIRLAA